MTRSGITDLCDLCGARDATGFNPGGRAVREPVREAGVVADCSAMGRVRPLRLARFGHVARFRRRRCAGPNAAGVTPRYGTTVEKVSLLQRIFGGK